MPRLFNNLLDLQRHLRETAPTLVAHVAYAHYPNEGAPHVFFAIEERLMQALAAQAAPTGRITLSLDGGILTVKPYGITVYIRDLVPTNRDNTAMALDPSDLKKVAAHVTGRLSQTPVIDNNVTDGDIVDLAYELALNTTLNQATLYHIEVWQTNEPSREAYLDLETNGVRHRYGLGTHPIGIQGNIGHITDAIERARAINPDVLPLP